MMKTKLIAAAFLTAIAAAPAHAGSFANELRDFSEGFAAERVIRIASPGATVSASSSAARTTSASAATCSTRCASSASGGRTTSSAASSGACSESVYPGAQRAHPRLTFSLRQGNAQGATSGT